MIDHAMGVETGEVKARERILVFADGRPDAELNSKGVTALIESTQGGDLVSGEVIGCASSYQSGSVKTVADRFDLPFYFAVSGARNVYAKILRLAKPDLCVFCGWKFPVVGLDPAKTISVSRGFEGDYAGAHQQVMTAYMRGEATETAITVCFVSSGEFVPGPKIISIPVRILIGAGIQPPTGEMLEGSPEERMARIIRRAMRAAQVHYLPQIIEHVLRGFVALNSDGTVIFSDSIVSDSYHCLTQSVANHFNVA